MKRVALVFGVVTLLLFADGIYLLATHNEVGGDTGVLFGNPNNFLSAGTVVVISGLFLLVATRDHVAGGGPPRRRTRQERRSGGRSAHGARRMAGRQRRVEAEAGAIDAMPVSCAPRTCRSPIVGAARAALRHVNLGVAPGEVVLITGRPAAASPRWRWRCAG